MLRIAGLVCCVQAVLTAACAPRAVGEAAPAAGTAGEVSSTAFGHGEAGGPALQVASARAGLRPLEVEGFLPAVFFVPAGEGARRLVVAAHGAGGAPEWECEYWRRLTRERAFVLCLRGKAMGGGSYYYPNHHALEAELVAAERAARAAEPRILPDGAVFAGFSQGASMGSVMLSRHGADFPYLALIEGFELWNIPRARAFAQGGGRRVLLACGTEQCGRVAEESVRWLIKGGVEARLERAPGAGHTPAGAVMERVEGALPWLLGEP